MPTLQEAIEQAIAEGKMLEDEGGEWNPIALLDALQSAREYEWLEQEVTVNKQGIIVADGEMPYRFKR